MGRKWHVNQLIAHLNMTCLQTSSALRQQLDKRLVFVPFSRKTLLSFKSENTTSPSVKEAQCGFGCLACRLFTGTARVKRGKQKQQRQRLPQKWNQQNSREVLGGADSVLHGSKQNSSAARRNWHFAQFYK